MLNFKPVITEDGTLSLYNEDVKDVYHSKIGAYIESLKKFIIPSEILDFVKSNNKVKILDVCYGLGYNTKTTINEIWKVNPSCKISIVALELDPNIVCLSAFIKFNNINPLCQKLIYELISSHPLFNKIIEVISNDVTFKALNETTGFFNRYKVVSNDDLSVSLHNTYYQTISLRNKPGEKLLLENDLLNIELFICDAREIILSLGAENTEYDYIFYDPFTPYKLPTLWSVELFKELYKLLSLKGNLVTYTSSAAVRAGMIEAGFYLGQSEPVGRKANGTIAYKDKRLIKSPINTFDQGILNTNAGIPYYDPNLNFEPEEIFRLRESIQKKSNRPSTSKYLKQHKK